MGRVGKDFEKLTVCAEIVPVGGLGVLTSGAIYLEVNGETKQTSDLVKLIWNIPELLADLTRTVTWSRAA